MCWRGTLTHFQFLLKNVTTCNPPWSLNLPNELYSRAENYTYWISCHILYIKSFLKSPGQELSEYIVFNSSWEFHFAKFRFQAVVLFKKKSESRYVTYYSLLFLPHEIIPKDLSRSSTSLPWVRIFGLRIKAIREKMPPKLFEISSPSISSTTTTNAMASLSSVEERTQFLRHLPICFKITDFRNWWSSGYYTCSWIWWRCKAFITLKVLAEKK